MNYKKNLLIAFLALTGLFMSCRDESLYPLPYNDREVGAYMRVVRLTSNVLDLDNIANTGLEGIFEFVDDSNGENLQDFQIFVRVRRGATLTQEALVTTIDGAQWQTVPEPTYSEYKRASIRVTANQTLTALNTVGFTGPFAAGDAIIYRGVIRLRDGRTFTDVNSGPNIIGGQFYASSFVYTLTARNLTPGSWVGTYSLTQNAIWSPNHSVALHQSSYPANLNQVLFPNQTVTLTVPAGGLSTEREFQVQYRGATVTMRLNLESGVTWVPLQNSTVDCTAERELYWTMPTTGTFAGSTALPAGLPQASTPNRGSYSTTQTGLVPGQVMTIGIDDDADEYGRRNGYCTWTRRVRLTLTKL